MENVLMVNQIHCILQASNLQTNYLPIHHPIPQDLKLKLYPSFFPLPLPAKRSTTHKIVHATCCVHDPSPLPLCHHDLSISSTPVRLSNVSTSHVGEVGRDSVIFRWYPEFWGIWGYWRKGESGVAGITHGPVM